MASTLSGFRAPTVVSSAMPQNNPNKKTPARSGNNWWAPLFKWSAEPDYIEPVRETEPGRVNFRGCFTEEKAKEMRKKTIESSTFHDLMYHSAIASRLASDISDR